MQNAPSLATCLGCGYLRFHHLRHPREMGQASAMDQVCRETVAKLGMLCGPSIMLGRNGPILEKPCSAIDLKHQREAVLA